MGPQEVLLSVLVGRFGWSRGAFLGVNILGLLQIISGGFQCLSCLFECCWVFLFKCGFRSEVWGQFFFFVHCWE